MIAGAILYWFNNNFSNLTRSILFPGGGGGSPDIYPMGPHLNAGSLGAPSGHFGSDDYRGPGRRPNSRDTYDGDAAADAAAYDRMTRQRGRGRYDYDYRDSSELDTRPMDTPALRKKPNPNEPPPKNPGIFGKVPLFPMGKPKPLPPVDKK